MSSWCVRSMDILFQLFISSRTTQDDHTHVTNSTLTITNIELLDGGVYSCSADNGVTDYSIGHALVYCSKLHYFISIYI